MTQPRRGVAVADYQHTPSHPSATDDSIMGYFTYLAEQAFGETESGERLFYPMGVMSRPYLISDDATRERLFCKQLGLMRLFVGGLIVAQPILFALISPIMTTTSGFALYMVAVLLVGAVIAQVTLRGELKPLTRVNTTTPLRAYYRSFARRHRPRTLVLGLVGSLTLCILGICAVATGENALPGWLGIVFFGVCTVAWGYALDLRHEEPGGRDPHAGPVS